MTNRCGFPKHLKSTGRSQRGEYDWLQCQKTGILATRWCDKRDIYFMSNCVIPEVDDITIKRHNKVDNSNVKEHNTYMGAVAVLSCCFPRQLPFAVCCVDSGVTQFT